MKSLATYINESFESVNEDSATYTTNGNYLVGQHGANFYDCTLSEYKAEQKRMSTDDDYEGELNMLYVPEDSTIHLKKIPGVKSLDGDNVFEVTLVKMGNKKDKPFDMNFAKEGKKVISDGHQIFGSGNTYLFEALAEVNIMELYGEVNESEQVNSNLPNGWTQYLTRGSYDAKLQKEFDKRDVTAYRGRIENVFFRKLESSEPDYIVITTNGASFKRNAKTMMWGRTNGKEWSFARWSATSLKRGLSEVIGNNELPSKDPKYTT